MAYYFTNAKPRSYDDRGLFCTYHVQKRGDWTRVKSHTACFEVGHHRSGCPLRVAYQEVRLHSSAIYRVSTENLETGPSMI